MTNRRAAYRRGGYRRATYGSSQASKKVFYCPTCRRRHYVKYKPKSPFCSQCGVKLRQDTRKEMKTLAKGLTVTTGVEQRLKRTSEATLPQTQAERDIAFGEAIQSWSFPVLLVLAGSIVVMWAILSIETLGLGLFLAIMLVTGGYVLVNSLVDQSLRGARATHEQRVSDDIVRLARERNERLREQQTFYSSPEWQTLRQQVIIEEGSKCHLCNVMIKDPTDVTVDHIRPRSRYPNLALVRSNLQVLCRRCNSRKGTSEIL